MHRAIECVKQFHEKFGLDVRDVPTLPEKEESLERMRQLEYQYHEYRAAERACDLCKIADALADMVHVICSTSLMYGIPLQTVFLEIHRSNLTKQGMGEDGRMVKGPKFDSPKIADILVEAIYGKYDI